MSFDFLIQDGDISIGSNGDLQKVENSQKLEQDILKIAVTPLGGNLFHTWYGSPISKSLIGTAFDMQFTSTIASGQLQNAIETLQKLQTIQASYQVVSPSEQISAIAKGGISIDRNQTDPRFFTVVISVIAKDLSFVTTGFNIKPTL